MSLPEDKKKRFLSEASYIAKRRDLKGLGGKREREKRERKYLVLK